MTKKRPRVAHSTTRHSNAWIITVVATLAVVGGMLAVSVFRNRNREFGSAQQDDTSSSQQGISEPDPASLKKCSVPRIIKPTILRKYPHDAKAFTQGLEFDSVDPSVVWESTGMESSVRKVDLATGSLLATYDLAPDMFGEGLTQVGDELYQLTWRNHRVFVYDREDLSLKRTLKFRLEGWGLCHDASRGRLVTTDGSHKIFFTDYDMAITGKLNVRVSQRVTEGGAVEEKLVTHLNELECVAGGRKVLANVWMQDWIILVELETGCVEQVVDLSGLGDPFWRKANQDAVLNGIAAHGNRVVVTGKLWPLMYEFEMSGI